MNYQLRKELNWLVSMVQQIKDLCEQKKDYPLLIENSNQEEFDPFSLAKMPPPKHPYTEGLFDGEGLLARKILRIISDKTELQRKI